MPKNNGKARRQMRKMLAEEREKNYDTIDCKACGGRHSTEWNCIRQEKLSNGKKPPADIDTPEGRLLTAIFGK